MNTVQAAFEQAIIDFKGKLKDQSLYSKILQTTSINEVYSEIEKLQNEQAKAGRLRHMSKIEPFMARLRGYSAVIETFVQAKPDILALIWGPIKLLLLWADTWKQSFDALVNTLQDVGNHLPSFCELAELFEGNKHLQELLVLYFRDILDVYRISINLFSMRRLRIVFEMVWPSHRDQINAVVKHISTHKYLIRQEVRMEEIRGAEESRQRALQHIIQTEENNIKQEYTSHRAYISPKDYNDELYRFSEAVCDGTGKWLLRHPSFQQWLAGKEKQKPIMWLRGIPGAGKTHLSSTVIKHVQQCDGTHTVFAFLSYVDGDMSALSVLHSLIFQLSSHSLTLKTILCQSDLKYLGTDLKIAANLFQSLIQGAGVVYVIVDGLDEINQVQRSKLIKELVRLSTECDDCRILLTSRPETDISNTLDGKTSNLQVDHKNAGSIQLYIDHTMDKWFEEREFVPEVRHQLRGWAAPLASRAKGMFLYVKIIFDIIHYINDLEEIQRELENLPLSLEAAYGRVLRKINLSTNRQRNLAHSILGWVACAPTPMTLKEIEQALVVDLENPSKDPKVQSKTNVVEICGPIVEIVNGYIQFVHFTVREYMFNPNIENSISLPDMALDLTLRCLTYLCQDHHDPELTEDEVDKMILLGAYRLHHFSSELWLVLINRYLVLSDSKTLPETLIAQLRRLFETRSSNDYIKPDECGINLHSAIAVLESDEPDLVEMLKGCSDFHASFSKSDLHLNNPEQWFHTSPLSIPQVSTSLYMRFCDLADRGDSTMESMPYHYGPHFFTCGFLGCQYLRHGFETKARRKDHERQHQKPWNCNFEYCQYATKGFLSRKMRDDHLQNAHQRIHRPDFPDSATLKQPGNEEIQPLMFDLIESNQVEIIKSLIPRLEKLDRSVLAELAVSAAKEGRTSIIREFRDCGLLEKAFTLTSLSREKVLGYGFGTFATVTIQSGSASLSKLSLSWIANLGLEHVALVQITSAIISSDSQELFDLWKPSIDSAYQEELRKTFDRPVTRALVRAHVLQVTKNSPSRECMLISLWKEYKVMESLVAPRSKRLLATVAEITCSVNLARYMLNHGYAIDAKLTAASPTALHIAARQNTQKAAVFIEFLLAQGADPENGTPRKKIRDEKGAQQIEKWLGITWDQLIEKTAKERQGNQENEMVA